MTPPSGAGRVSTGPWPNTGGQLQRGLDRIRAAQSGLAEVALGGAAVGSGINTHPEFAAEVTGLLSGEFDIDVRETENHFQAQNSLDAAVFLLDARRLAGP